MLPKRLALLLVFSWVILSGFDVIEDLDLPDQIELHNSSDALSRGPGSAALVARNVVESAVRACMRCWILPGHSFELTAIYIPSLSHRIFKLHKIHQVFLI